MERRAGHAAVTQLVLIMLVVGASLLLMRNLSISGAGPISFEGQDNNAQKLLGYI